MEKSDRQCERPHQVDGRGRNDQASSRPSTLQAPANTPSANSVKPSSTPAHGLKAGSQRRLAQPQEAPPARRGPGRPQEPEAADKQASTSSANLLQSAFNPYDLSRQRSAAQPMVLSSTAPLTVQHGPIPTRYQSVPMAPPQVRYLMHPQHQQQLLPFQGPSLGTAYSPKRPLVPLGQQSGQLHGFLVPTHYQTVPQQGPQPTANTTHDGRRNVFALGRPIHDLAPNERGLGMFSPNRRQRPAQNRHARTVQNEQMPPPLPRAQPPVPLHRGVLSAYTPGLTDRGSKRAFHRAEAPRESKIEDGGRGMRLRKSEWGQGSQLRTDAIDQVEQMKRRHRNDANFQQFRNELFAIAARERAAKGTPSFEHAHEEMLFELQQAEDREKPHMPRPDPAPHQTPPSRSRRRAPGWGAKEDPFGRELEPFDLSGLDQDTALNCLTPPERSLVPQMWSGNGRVRRSVAADRQAEADDEKDECEDNDGDKDDEDDDYGDEGDDYGDEDDDYGDEDDDEDEDNDRGDYLHAQTLAELRRAASTNRSNSSSYHSYATGSPRPRTGADPSTPAVPPHSALKQPAAAGTGGRPGGSGKKRVRFGQGTKTEDA